jgi:hypothetical protein
VPLRLEIASVWQVLGNSVDRFGYRTCPLIGNSKVQKFNLIFFGSLSGEKWRLLNYLF